MRAWPLLLLAPLLCAGEPAWDHLPWAVYSEEQLDLAGELPPGWTLRDEAGRSHELDPETGLHLPAEHLRHLRLIDDQGREAGGLSLLRPGRGGALRLEQGRLWDEDELVVLTLSRLEHVEDRRWMVLRRDRDAAVPCTTRIAAPAVERGESGLLALIAAARRAPVAKAGILVELPASDRLVGWNHRAYRQSLAWLVADLWRRGAARVVLVLPPVPPGERDLVEPLWTQARDVARTYRCELVDVAPLLDERHWLVGPGLLGERLNSGGRAALDQLVAPYLAPE